MEKAGEYDGIMPRGNPFPKKETCCILKARLARAPSRGNGSPGTALAVPSITRGVATSKSQKAESMAVLSLAMVSAKRKREREKEISGSATVLEEALSLCFVFLISLSFWNFENRRAERVFMRFLYLFLYLKKQKFR